MVAKRISQSSVDLVERHLEWPEDELVKEATLILPRSTNKPLAQPFCEKSWLKILPDSETNCC